MVPDYHMHTVLCKHASGSVRDYHAAAAEKSIPEICFTDHAPNPDGVGDDVCMAMGQFPEYVQMVGSLQNVSAPEVLLGIEADYYAGCEKHLSHWLLLHELDYVLGSIHFVDNWAFDHPRALPRWEREDVTQVWRRYFALVADMVDTGLFDAVGHIDLAKKFGHRPKDDDLREIVRPVLDKIVAAEMAIEINTSGLRRPVKEIYPSPLLLSLAREREIPVVFGSDAHGPEEVGADFDQALLLARECGYTEYVRFKSRNASRCTLPPEGEKG